jgi:hypothetical protein
LSLSKKINKQDDVLDKDKPWIMSKNIIFIQSQKSLNKHLPARKLMVTVFWDRKGILMMEFMQQGATVMSQTYCETLKILRRAMGLLTYGVVLLHDEICIHIQLLTLEHCWSISTGNCKTTFLTVLISL